MIDARRHVVPAMFAVFIFAPNAWWLMDRDAPYVRESGVIVAATPESCGLPQGSPVGLFAGGCAAAEWKIKPQRACQGSEPFNVHRTMIDAKGARHTLPVTGSIYRRTAGAGDLTRYFVIPETMPAGATTYISEACFACNPQQYVAFPICVDKPELAFTIDEPPK